MNQIAIIWFVTPGCWFMPGSSARRASYQLLEAFQVSGESGGGGLVKNDLTRLTMAGTSRPKIDRESTVLGPVMVALGTWGCRGPAALPLVAACGPLLHRSQRLPKLLAACGSWLAACGSPFPPLKSGGVRVGGVGGISSDGSRTARPMLHKCDASWLFLLSD